MIHLFTACTLLLAATDMHSPAQKAIKKHGSQQGLSPAQEAMKHHNEVQSHLAHKRISRIEQVLSDGLILVLTDGTRWEVNKNDLQYTSAWLGSARVSITKNPHTDRLDSYPYIMTNLATKTKVRVKQLE